MKKTLCKILGTFLITLSGAPVALAAEPIIQTVAGTGAMGFFGDNGPAIAAELDRPVGVAVDKSGNLYIPDAFSNRVRKVDAEGIITTAVGDGTIAVLNGPHAVAFDKDGNLYVADSGNNRIQKMDTAGNLSPFAGTGTPGGLGDGGDALAAELNDPRGLAFDALGNLYIADYGNHKIRMVDTLGKISTVAGTGVPGNQGDNGDAELAQLNQPRSVAVDQDGNLFIADATNHRIRKVDAVGKILAFAGTGTPGSGGIGGPAVAAELSDPRGITLDQAGNLLIADSGSHRVLKVDSDGNIHLLAGNGLPGFSGDGGDPLQAQFNVPNGLAVDGLGNLYISDFKNNRVRVIGEPSALGHNLGSDGSGDSGEASEETADVGGCQLQSAVRDTHPVAILIYLVVFNLLFIRRTLMKKIKLILSLGIFLALSPSLWASNVSSLTSSRIQFYPSYPYYFAVKCGNGIVENGEECDDHNVVDGDGCSDTCQIEDPECGNGILEAWAGEGCDDGNNDGMDGCSSFCKVEPGWICYGSPSVCDPIGAP